MAGERQLPGLGLYGFWTLGSNGYKTQNDENLLKISALLQASAISFVSFLPGVPTNGDIYILDATADIHKIAVRDNGAWTLLTPDAGWMVYVVSESGFYVFDGSTWGALDAAPGLPVLAGAGDANKALRANGPGTAYVLVTVQDLPALAGGADAAKQIRANAGGTAYELFVPVNLPSFTTGDALKVVRVNAAETGYELAAPGGGGGGATTFVALTDTPASYSGQALKAVRVNAGATALEFYDPSTGTNFDFMVAVSDETTALTTGTAKVTFRMPRAMTLSSVKASVGTAPTGGTLLTVDINEGGVSILSTKLTFDSGERTTTTAATPAVISDANLAADAEITIDIDAVGSTIAGAGLKVTLIGVYA